MTKLSDKIGLAAFIMWIIGSILIFFDVELMILLDYTWMHVVCPTLLIIALACWATAFGLLVMAVTIDRKEE